MMLAEQEFSPGGEHCTDVCGCAAPIAAVGSGQLRAGKRAGHDFILRPGQVSATRPGRTGCGTHGIHPSTLTSDPRAPLLQTNAVFVVFPR